MCSLFIIAHPTSHIRDINTTTISSPKPTPQPSCSHSLKPTRTVEEGPNPFTLVQISSDTPISVALGHVEAYGGTANVTRDPFLLREKQSGRLRVPPITTSHDDYDYGYTLSTNSNSTLLLRKPPPHPQQALNIYATISFDTHFFLTPTRHSSP